MLGTREYTLCSPFRANAHNSSYLRVQRVYVGGVIIHAQVHVFRVA